jgi:hypothetical protein
MRTLILAAALAAAICPARADTATDNNLKFLAIVKAACLTQPAYPFCHGPNMLYNLALFCNANANKSEPVCIELAKGPPS